MSTDSQLRDELSLEEQLVILQAIYEYEPFSAPLEMETETWSGVAARHNDAFPTRPHLTHVQVQQVFEKILDDWAEQKVVRDSFPSEYQRLVSALLVQRAADGEDSDDSFLSVSDEEDDDFGLTEEEKEAEEDSIGHFNEEAAMDKDQQEKKMLETNAPSSEKENPHGKLKRGRKKGEWLNQENWERLLRVIKEIGVYTAPKSMANIKWDEVADIVDEERLWLESSLVNRKSIKRMVGYRFDAWNRMSTSSKAEVSPVIKALMDELTELHRQGTVSRKRRRKSNGMESDGEEEEEKDHEYEEIESVFGEEDRQREMEVDDLRSERLTRFVALAEHQNTSKKAKKIRHSLPATSKPTKATGRHSLGRQTPPKPRASSEATLVGGYKGHSEQIERLQLEIERERILLEREQLRIQRLELELRMKDNLKQRGTAFLDEQKAELVSHLEGWAHSLEAFKSCTDRVLDLLGDL